MLPNELADPFPTWARLRRETPIFYSEIMGCYVVTRYDDIVEVLKDTERFSSKDALHCPDPPLALRDRLPNGYPNTYPSIGNTDPPEHTRLRKIVQSVLKPSRINAMRPTVENIASSLVNVLPLNQAFDFMAAVAVPLPIDIISIILGIPEQDRAQFRVWSDDTMLVLNPMIDDETRYAASARLADFNDYLLQAINIRRTDRGTDLISDFVWAHSDGSSEPLTDPELIAVFAQLGIAGNETTRNGLGNMMYLLLSHPDQWNAVCNDASLRWRAIEETVRRLSPVRALQRTVTTDVSLGGIQLTAGNRILVPFSAANHDQSHFPDPERFNIARNNVKHHIAFGFGEHFCLGSPLARQTLATTLDLLCVFGERLQLSGDPEWRGNFATHGFEELPMRIRS